MRSVLLLFAIIALLVGLLGLLSLPPLKISMKPFEENMTVPVGGPLDTGPNGASKAYSVIEDLGYRIVLNSTGAGYDGVIVIITNESYRHRYSSRGDWVDVFLHAVASSRKHYAIVIAPGEELERLFSYINTKVYINYRNTNIYNINKIDLKLALTSDGKLWYSASFPYTSRAGLSAEESGAKVVVRALPGREPLAVLLNWQGSKILAYLAPRNSMLTPGVSSEFSNYGIRDGVEAGLDIYSYLDSLLRLAGGSPGDTLLAPPGAAYWFEPLPGAEPLETTINLRRTAAEILGNVLEEESRIVRELWDEPVVPALIGIAVPLIMIPASRVLSRGLALSTGREEALEEHKPIEGTGLSAAYLKAARIASSRKLSKADAKNLISALYNAVDYMLRERLGGGVKETLQDPRLLREASVRSGIPVERLEAILSRLDTLYTRKVVLHKLLPLVNLEKEARSLLEALKPLLEGLGLDRATRASGGESRSGSGEG